MEGDLFMKIVLIEKYINHSEGTFLYAGQEFEAQILSNMQNYYTVYDNNDEIHFIPLEHAVEVI